MAAHAKFTGVVTFRDTDAARQLAKSVNDMLRGAVSIYNDAYQDSKAPMELQRVVDNVVRLCDHFLVNSKIAARTNISNELHTMKVEQTTLRRILLVEYEHYTAWTLAQSDQIGASLNVIFGCLERLMNLHDLERIEAILDQIKVCLRATKALVGEKGKHISVLVEDFRSNCEFLCKVFDLRLSVMKDEELKARLTSAKETITANIPLVVSSCKATRKDTSKEKMDAKQTHAKAMATALQECTDIISFGFVVDVDYETTKFDDRGFNNNIDALLNCIETGNVDEAADEAMELTTKLRLMDAGKGLEDAKAKIHQQTADLLSASKRALEEKDSQDAQALLASLVKNMKSEVASFAKQEQAHMRRQKRLLQKAGALGQAIDTLEDGTSSTSTTPSRAKPQLPAFATIADLNGLVADLRLTMAQVRK